MRANKCQHADGEEGKRTRDSVSPDDWVESRKRRQLMFWWGNHDETKDTEATEERGGEGFLCLWSRCAGLDSDGFTAYDLHT